MAGWQYNSYTSLVDITSLQRPDDVWKDCFGRWIHTGSCSPHLLKQVSWCRLRSVHQEQLEMCSTCIDSMVIIPPILSFVTG